MAVSEEECSTAKSQSTPSSSSAPVASQSDHHYLAKYVLRGSVVLQVAYGHLRSSSTNDIVFGKETSIELLIIGEDGIAQSVCEQAVFGTIKDLAVIPWNEKFYARNPQIVEKDLLVVLSDSGKLSFLTFCNEMHRFSAVAHVQLSGPGNSRSQLGRMLAVDPSGCFVAVSAYEDRLALFSVSMYSGSNIIDKRIYYPPESEGDTLDFGSLRTRDICGTIWSMCFISKDPSQPSKEHNPVLAIILNREGEPLNELLLLEWNVEGEAVCVFSVDIEDGQLAHGIVEVPHSYGYAFLFRVGDLLLMDLRDACNPCRVYKTGLNFLPPSVEEQNFVEDPYRVQDLDDDGLNEFACALLELRKYDPMCIDGDFGEVGLPPKQACLCSWSWEPGNGRSSRMIFSVDTGEYFMIEISFDSDGAKVSLSESLYTGQPSKGLLWVEGGYLAALVEMGDGMVLKVDDGRLLYLNPIQNIAPILDMSVVDYHDEKRDQMFACCGVAPEGSLRIIRSGISVEKLLRTAPIYQGITGTWTVRMKVTDPYHSFLVLSFVEETRVLSVGLSFTDVTDSVGFQPDVCTLACGLASDGLLIQIHQNAVRLCLPTKIAHCEGIPMSSPVCTYWFPDNMSISLGAVAHNLIIVSTSNPCFLYILGVRSLSKYQYEIYEMQHLRVECELSCISVPQKHNEKKRPSSSINLVGAGSVAALPLGVDIGYTFVIGTHKPSVEILSFTPEAGLEVLASGAISLMSTAGTAISGCVPQDVRLVYVDQLYVLLGLRNGMLLRFEWPSASSKYPYGVSNSSSMNSMLGNADAGLSDMAGSSCGLPMSAVNSYEQSNGGVPVNLQLIATRRIGITPVFLVPLTDSLDTDIIALSDRPWLLHTARHSLAYTSISFQSSTQATPVCSAECPQGILFVAENSLNLVEMVHSKRLNVQKFHLGGTPRKVLYHSGSRLLIVMRTDLRNDTCSSDVCIVDPLSGSVVSSFKFERGETGKSMELVRVGNDQVLVVGTSLSSGPAIMPSGEAESTKGRLIVLCIEHVQHSDSGSMDFYPKAGSSSRTSPFREIVAEQSYDSVCSSPDDTSWDGIKVEETEAWQFRLAYSNTWSGMVLAISSYLDRYFLASAGNAFYVCGFSNNNPQRVRRYAIGRTRFTIMLLTTHFTRIAVGDCRDGILFYCFHEDARKLEQIYCDPSQRLVAASMFVDTDTAVVSDRKGTIAILSCSDQLEDNASPECNLSLSCAYYMGEIAMSIRKGSYIYKLPADDVVGSCDGPSAIETSQSTIIASTLLGGIVVFIPISREEYDLLEAVQARLAAHPLTAPVLGNDHNEYRGREILVGVPKILDGDMLSQFLELTSKQQETILSIIPSSLRPFKSASKPQHVSPLPMNRVVQLLERVHYALN